MQLCLKAVDKHSSVPERLECVVFMCACKTEVLNMDFCLLHSFNAINLVAVIALIHFAQSILFVKT